MTRAVRALVPFAFDALRLHRLEAACIPTNQASIRLLEKTGFTREGYAREYLCINGVWQDHLLLCADQREHGPFNQDFPRLIDRLGPAMVGLL